MQPLPLQAQFSKVFGILGEDLNKDGKKDILLTGNFFLTACSWEEMTREWGLWLKSDGAGGFKVMSNEEAGLFIDGDVRNMISLKTKMVKPCW